MPTGSTSHDFWNRLLGNSTAIRFERQRHFEIFTRIHLLFCIGYLLALTPLLLWLDNVPPVIGPLCALLGWLVWCAHRCGYVDTATLIQLGMQMALTLGAQLAMGTTAGFGYYCLLALLVLYLSDFSWLTKLPFAAGFWLLEAGVIFYLRDHLPWWPMTADLRELVRLYNLGILALGFGAVLMIVDRVVQRYHSTATLDALTRVFNRRGIMTVCEYCHRRGMDYAVLVIDVDHFKHVNDSWGHARGDEVLCHLVATMRHVLRGQDLIGRIGGEEFLVLLNALTVEEACRMAEHLRHRVACEPCLSGSQTLQVTVSIGVAMRHAHDHSHERVIERADQRLYQAKQQGRNRVIAN